MRRLRLLWIDFMVIFLLNGASFLFGQNLDQREYKAGEIIVKLKPNENEKSQNLLSSLMDSFRAKSVTKLFSNSGASGGQGKVDLSRIYRVMIPENINPKVIAQKIRQNEFVEYAEPVYRRRLCLTPNDEFFSDQWHYKTVDAEAAWGISKGDSSIIIGIVDSGIDWQHPDIAGKIWINPNEIPDNGIDDDQNGFVDDVRGWDFAEWDNDPANTSSRWLSAHGTHVAGLAGAATNNEIGVAGMGYNCRVMALKVTQDYDNDPYQTPYAGFEAIKYAVDNGAQIINCSWSGGIYSDVEFDIVEYAHEHGVVIVAAAGNDGDDALSYPASYPHVISVASSDNMNQKAYDSNYHTTVDITAPGVDLKSTWGYGLEYGLLSGTSMASPVVAGAIGLVLAHHPDWTAEQAAQQVRVTAEDIYYLNPKYSMKMGKGRLNAHWALSKTSPAIQLVSYSVDDSKFGNNNGSIEKGERVQIYAEFHNFLLPATNVNISIYSKDPLLNIISDNINFSQVEENTIYSNGENPFEIEFSEDIPDNYTIELLVDISADSDYSDWDSIQLVASPLFATHSIGNVALTVTSFGAFGYYDYAVSKNSFGSGFQYPIGSSSSLFHASLMVAAGPEKVSDAAYGNAAMDICDFSTTENGQISVGYKISDQDFYAEFDDSQAENPIGVKVSQNTFAWEGEPNDDFVIAEFTLMNTNENPFDSLFVALYLDWDVGDYSRNYVDYDFSEKLGFQYASGSKFCGAALVSPDTAAAFRALDNDNDVWTNNYSDERKWEFMTEGFLLTKGEEPKDWSMILSAGPFEIQPGEFQKVAFAFVGGEDVDDLLANTKAAREIYIEKTAAISLMNDNPQIQHFALSPNFPNPFNQSTRFTYSLPKECDVRIRIFNIRGQIIKNLVHARQVTGHYSLFWDGAAQDGKIVPSGVYFLQLVTDDFCQTNKLIFMK